MEEVAQLDHLGPAAEHRRQHGAVAGDGDLLWQVADPQVLGSDHASCIGALLADEDLDQAGLADPVRPDQRNPPTGGERDGHVVEEHTAAVRECQSRGRQHRRRSSHHDRRPPTP